MSQAARGALVEQTAGSLRCFLVGNRSKEDTRGGVGIEFRFSDRQGITESMHVVRQDLAREHLSVVHSGEQKFTLNATITAIILPRTLDILRFRDGPA